MTVTRIDHRDLNVLFEELEWLLAHGVHPARACQQVGYHHPKSICRLYYRHHRPIPAALQQEVAYQRHGHIA